MIERSLLTTLADLDPSRLDTMGETDKTTERILSAAYEQIAIVGWRRSTIDDVARRAGIGRATVYRKFPSKAELVEAVLLREVRRYVEGSSAVAASATTIGERMAESATYTVEYLHEHALLRRLVETEPESILPALTVDAAPLIAAFREFCANLWQHEIYGSTKISDAQRGHLITVAELHIRIALSFILTHDTAIPIATADQAREFTRRYLAPMLDAPAHSVDIGK